MSLLKNRMTAHRPRVLVALAVAVPWVLAGCVDLTPPWEKVTVKGGAGAPSRGGAGGLVPDGPVASGGSLDSGAGWQIDSGGGGVGGAIDGAGGANDAPSTGGAGEIEAGLGGAGGFGLGGSIIDGPMVGTGGAAGGMDGGSDVPLGGGGGGPGTGGNARFDGATGIDGATGAGGTARTGGTTGTGGKTGTGGATGTGGRTGTGGTTGTGGATSTGGATMPDARADLQPDAGTLANGLLAYYPCESASGSSLPDMSGHDPPNDATLSASGSYSFGSGPKAGLGNALTLTQASSGYVQMPPAMFRGLTQITIATWVKIVTATNWQRLFDIGVNANLSENPISGTNTISYMNFVPQGYNSGPAVFGITKTGYANEQRVSWTSALPIEWRHVAIVLSGSTGTLYVDGVPDGGSPMVNTSMTLRPVDLGAIDYAYIGRSQFSVDPYFEGTIDEFRVYDRALSATEIQALYNFAGP